MNLDVAEIIPEEDNSDYDDFLNKMNSKLMLNLKRNEVVENTEWIDEVLFTIPYLVKAFEKANKIIITEEELVKVEVIKKVTVESVKHLSKHVNYVSDYNEDTGEVTPDKILNVNREETYVTYENRFLYTLMKLIDDFIYIRNREAKSDVKSKGKNYQNAKYEATTKIRREKITLKLEYISEKVSGESSEHDLSLKIQQIQEALRTVKSTNLYKFLDLEKVALVQPPLKMTNVLLKNVNYQYAVKLWNYLNENFDMKNKRHNITKEVLNKGYTQKMMDQTFLLDYIIFNKVNVQQNEAGLKNVTLTKEEKKEISEELMKKLFEIQPDVAENELKKMIVKRYIKYKREMEASTKPIKDRFKEEIDNYLLKIDKLRIKPRVKSE